MAARMLARVLDTRLQGDNIAADMSEITAMKQTPVPLMEKFMDGILTSRVRCSRVNGPTRHGGN